MNKHKLVVKDYYETSQWLYNLFWSKKVMGIHFGFWENETKNQQEALLNQNKEIVKLGQIKKDDRILDAGCGVGGTAIYIAKTVGTKVIGITLSPTQVKMAKMNAKKYGVKELTDFRLMDYTKTKFKKDSFDVVYGLESICYATPKLSFLKEAFRILKPGGRLVISDGYLFRKPKNIFEKKIVDDFCEGFALKEFTDWQEMSEQIKLAGFSDIKKWNRTKKILPSVKNYRRLSKSFWPIVSILKLIPSRWTYAVVRNYNAAVAVENGIEKKLFGYGTHAAVKPD